MRIWPFIIQTIWRFSFEWSSFQRFGWALTIPMILTIWKPDCSKSWHFCHNFKWFLTKWRPFIHILNGWASRYQIPFEIFKSHLKSGLFANQPLYNNSKSGRVRITDPHCITIIDIRNRIELCISWNEKKWNEKTVVCHTGMKNHDYLKTCFNC